MTPHPLDVCQKMEGVTMMYRVIWTNRKTGGSGESDTLYTSREQAEDVARAADVASPEIQHFVKEEVR